MINFFTENNFQLHQETLFKEWITACAKHHNKIIGEVNFIFCDDEYLYNINQQYLNHDTLTDIISFDDSDGDTLNGDIFISTERVQENAQDRDLSFTEELARVLIHGILHFSGFNDKTESETKQMRSQEDQCLQMLHQFVPRET